MKDTDLIALIRDDSKLSESSKETLIGRFQRLLSISGNSFMWIMLNPNKMTAKIKATDLSCKTKVALCSCVCSVFGRATAVSERHPAALARWKAICKELEKPIQEEYDSNVATDTYLQGHVPWKSILKKRDSLTKGSDQRLLLSMYTMIPPVRRNLGSCKIVSNGEDPPPQGNYIYIGSPPVLVLREYKTKKFYGENKVDLPKKLVAEIQSSLKVDPREYLFVSKGGEPFATDALYGSWVARTLKGVFSKPMTINTLRHCYLSETGVETKTVAERKEIASSMCHSVGMQMRYQFMDSPGLKRSKSAKT